MTDTEQQATLCIQNAVDISGSQQRIDVSIQDGVISDISTTGSSKNENSGQTGETTRVIDAGGFYLSAGFIDGYARLRDPGYEKKGTIESEARAAACNGITTLFCSPDTDPVIDEAATVELINRKARDSGFAKVLPIAALTQGLQGELLSELATLKAAGCVAASNADKPLTDLQVIRRCMDYARTFDIVLILNPADRWLTANGCVHEGATATRLGLPTIPVAAETVALAILIELAWQTGARIHFSRITSGRGIDMVAKAKQGGLPITADTSINHLIYDDSVLGNFDSLYSSVAPFRDVKDRDALRQAVADGTIDSICTDHSPHERDAKLAPFPSAAPGISGLDTFLPLLLKLEDESTIPLSQLLKAVTHNPAEIFGLKQGRLEKDAPADLIIFDALESFVLTESELLSKGHNSPQCGQQLRGRNKYTVVDGKVVFEKSQG